MSTPPTATISNDTSLRPYSMLDPFDALMQSTAQRAISEGRLEPVIDYQIAAASNRASYMTVIAGISAFIVAIVAVLLTGAAYLARTHQTAFHLEGGMLAFLILSNLGLGYLQLSVHEGLHGVVQQLAGGKPQYTFLETYAYHWSAPNQGFSRRFYAIVMLAPLGIFTALWVFVLALAPGVAAYSIVPLIVNVAISGADCWLVWAARQQPPAATVFVPLADGFMTYTIATSKPARKRSVTTPVKPTTTRR